MKIESKCTNGERIQSLDYEKILELSKAELEKVIVERMTRFSARVLADRGIQSPSKKLEFEISPKKI
jgi:hypothetical protein